MTDAPPASPLATPLPWDLVAEGYVAENLPVFEAFSTRALELAGVQAGAQIVDVAAGPGTLAMIAARRGIDVTTIDFSPTMTEHLRRRAAAESLRIDANVGDGMALPFDAARFDAGFSMFGLMFFPDRGRGFAELARVLRPGGTAVVSSWVAMERVALVVAAFEILGTLVPMPKGPPPKFALVDADECRAEMTAGGFEAVRVEEHAVTVEVPSAAEFAGSMERTNAPVVLMKQRMGDAWAPVAEGLRRGMQERFGEGPQAMTMTGNLIVGRRG